MPQLLRALLPVALAVVLASTGCDADRVEQVSLDLAGTVTDTLGLPVAGANLSLEGAYLDREGVVSPFVFTTSDADGRYAVRFTVPVHGVGPDGECLTRTVHGKVRVAMSGGDNHLLYASVLPRCTGEPQRVDLALKPVL